MRKLSATLLVSMGILASGSGIIQVSAADIIFETDFSTKEVANFNDFTQTFNEDTSDLTLSVDLYFFGNYKMNTCPPGSQDQNMAWQLLYKINTAPSFTTKSEALPDLPCSDLGFSTYQAFVSIDLGSSFLDSVVNDDTAFIQIRPLIVFGQNPNTPTISLQDWYVEITFNYDFNTTYLFNYFLSDQAYVFQQPSAGWSINSTLNTYLEYVMTTAGNDNYYIFNSNITNIGTTRKKYAIDYEDEYFRGQSIGSQFNIQRLGAADTVSTINNGSRTIQWDFNWYYLNIANKEQDIGNVPEFEYEYEDCGWNVFDIPCFINNGIAYVVNDAPVVSDAFTLLNAGMKLGGQAFSVIGQFSDNNLFGVLILGGLGITAVRWFLKND